MLKPGIYEEIISEKLKDEISQLDDKEFHIEKEQLDPEEARKLLSNYISHVARKALSFVREQGQGDQEKLLSQIRLANGIIKILSEQLDEEEFNSFQIDEKGEVLTSLYSRINTLSRQQTIRPVTPISQSSLFTGSSFEPNMLSELQKEILTSNHIDMLVSFIKWSGLRCMIEELKAFTDNGGRLRVITTSYMGASDYKAINELSQLQNTEIKISYDVERTRLHAKAYLFMRDTGFSTAYIGSSNLSNPALTSGLEWNLKVTEKDSLDIIKKFKATFESYWNNSEFKTFDRENESDHEQLKLALSKDGNKEENDLHFSFDIQPYYYQKEMLEKLEVEREVFGRYRNLLVAATGVGKTVISAFDYRRFLKKQGEKVRLLFVAHREEILKQSLDTFRVILKDFNFGDLLVGKHLPDFLDHVFVSIQSFNSKDLIEHTTPDFYDFIIVDEFHHAAAPSYQKLLNYYKPKVLLGLTATPDRMDGQSILPYFDGRIAAEMRLTEAIDQKLLSPFQYFCVSDTVDLSKLKWSRRGYEIKELVNVYTNNRIRSSQIVNSLKRYVTDLEDVKGLGFCVSVEHARYMAHHFNEVGIPALALDGESKHEIRSDAKQRLVSGNIKFIFVVDLYNEGVDIPEVNTVLFLRPTESLTVFLQQLGRGLRLAEGKECLTVLDFIGQAHKNYSFEEKFRALIGRTHHTVQWYVEEGFFNLPKGCFIQLEKQAKQYILRNLKDSANTKGNLLNKIREFNEYKQVEFSLGNFLEAYHLSLYDFYGKNGDRTFHRMKVEAGVAEDYMCEKEGFIAKRLPNLFHINSKKWLDFLISYIQEGICETQEENLMLGMFYYSFFQKEPQKEGFSNMEEGIQSILMFNEMKAEILSILNYNYSNLDQLELELSFDFPCPLGVHSRYTTAQVMAAFNYFNNDQCPAFREGVKYFENLNLDIFLFTLNKSDKDFSPSTLYEDYAINDVLFHWQSQSRTSINSPTAQRYIHHKKRGNKIALFVREYKQENGYTSPLIFLGEAEYVSHEGSQPVSVVWKLKHEMPATLVPKANKSII